MRLQNKVAIVTGAGSGFGEAIAKRYAQEGAKVVVNDLVEPAARRVADEIRAAGGEAEAQAGDVSRDADVERLVRATLERFGDLDIVVNNAGTTHRNRPMLEVDEAEFDRVYAVNVKSIYLTARHAVPHFRKRGGGCFVNIASTAGVRPRPGLTWYNGSKGAVITTSKSLAAEFAGGPLTEERKAKFRATIPLGRFSTALDVANAALYLASDEAAFISGVCIEVDGARCV